MCEQIDAKIIFSCQWMSEDLTEKSLKNAFYYEQ
jgi:hypothetical protein